MSRGIRVRFINIVMLCFIFAVTGMYITGCGDSDNVAEKDQSVQDESPKASKQSSAAEAVPLKMGESGKTETFEMSVISVNKPTQWTKSPRANYEYVVVAFMVKNLSGKAASISAGDFSCVENESGMRTSWERSTGIKADPDTFGAETIEPGNQFSGSVIFSLPVAMKTTECHYTKGYNPKPSLKFQINK